MEGKGRGDKKRKNGELIKFVDVNWRKLKKSLFTTTNLFRTEMCSFFE